MHLGVLRTRRWACLSARWAWKRLAAVLAACLAIWAGGTLPLRILLPCWGGNGSRGGCSENTPVTRYELELQQTIAAKDSEIADLKSSQYTDQKLVEVYTNLDRKANELRDLIQKNKDEQNAVNLNQAVYNGTNTAAVACLKGQVEQLQGLTKLVIPNDSCCPGWGEVKVAPATTTTTNA